MVNNDWFDLDLQIVNVVKSTDAMPISEITLCYTCDLSTDVRCKPTTTLEYC
ncbi:FDLD family class I lanthipeptide [Tumebacillus algifaecis]|uniref:FDLD family class I lanthipeptide n=1 Tax=Tumebacillus algifaecis TaxID=1214604 RepID=UPI00188247B4